MNAPRLAWTAAALLLSPTLATARGIVYVPGDVATIQLAIDGAASGDTVIVAPGTYNELIDLKGKGLTLRSDDPYQPSIVATTIITGAGLDGPVVSCVSGEGPSTVVAGFTITGGNGKYSSQADPRGGGLRCVNSSPTVTRCSIRHNTVGPHNGWVQGGGMYVEGGQPEILACEFLGNAVLATGGPVSIPAGVGGGLAIFEGSATVLNCLFAGNRAGGGSFDGGGGLYVRSAPAGVSVVNCTFAGNELVSPFASGGGILGDPVVANSVVWGNSGVQIGSLPAAGAFVFFCDVQGGYAGLGNIDADPLFARQPDPGPDLGWGTADDDFGDLRLGPGSPAIDAGNNAALPQWLIDDLDALARHHDDPWTVDSGSGSPPLVDLGAYEFHGSSTCGTSSASASPYGTGKPGSAGIPALSSPQLPALGQTADLLISGGLPNSDPVSQPLVLIVGTAPLSLPFDDGLLLAIPELVLNLGIGLDAAGSAAIPVPLSATPAHCGKRAYFQALLFGDPGASGFLHSAQTQGLEWVFGGG